MLATPPSAITLCLLQVVCMPNGEVICAGRTVGWIKDLGKYLIPTDQEKSNAEKQ